MTPSLLTLARLAAAARLWQGVSEADNVPTVNHFVIAIPVSGLYVVPPICMFRNDARGQRAMAASLNAGSARLATVANCDCGLDAMLYFLGREISAEHMQRLHRAIADALQGASGHAQLRTAFLTCQEMLAEPQPLSDCTSSATAKGDPQPRACTPNATSNGDPQPSACTQSATDNCDPVTPAHPYHVWDKRRGGGRAKGFCRGGSAMGFLQRRAGNGLWKGRCGVISSATCQWWHGHATR